MLLTLNLVGLRPVQVRNSKVRQSLFPMFDQTREAHSFLDLGV